MNEVSFFVFRGNCLVFEPAVVTSEGVGQEAVMFLSATANVVDDEGGAIGSFLV